MAEQLRHGRESRSIRSICLRLHQDLYQELQGENNGPVVRHDALQLQPSDVMVFFLWFLRCFVNFLSDTVMVFQVCFVKLNKNSLAHSFVHVERGYSEMHVFKCRSCFRYSEIPIFVSKNYFFWLRFLDRWVDWCWTGLQRNVHVFHVGCVFATAKLFFLCPIPWKVSWVMLNGATAKWRVWHQSGT